MESDSGNLRNNVLNLFKKMKTKRRILPSEYAAHLYPDLLAKYYLHYKELKKDQPQIANSQAHSFKFKNTWKPGGPVGKSRQKHCFIYTNNDNVVDLTEMAPSPAPEDDQEDPNKMYFTFNCIFKQAKTT